jgi:tetratricopeptide (TPR) repeat protein
MSTDTTPLPEVPDRLETVRMDALTAAAKDGSRGVLEMHRAIANRLLREGAPARAFSELVRATREVPMSARLAAALAHIALKAGTLSAAVTLLTQGLDEVEGAERTGVRHALARLYRRSDDLELAREQLVVLLAEHPTDRRARITLNALLEREERWDELDASLEKETREELRRGTLRRASRTALKRARLWGERLDNPARAALRYGQAAQFAEQGQDFESCFLLRLLWLRSLHKSHAPERAMTEAVEAALRAGGRVGKVDRVRHMVAELKIAGAPVPSLTDVAVPIVTEGAEQTHAQGKALPSLHPNKRNSTQIELMAVAAEAEKSGRKPEVAALLRAAIDEGPDPQALKRLEAHFVARGAWRELAQFYGDNAIRARGNTEKAQWKERLAELLESELNDPVGAARAWAEVVELTGDQRAVKEQVRLHSERKDAKSVRLALDEGVIRATAPQAKADALVARAEEALTRKDQTTAGNDFQAALAAVPQHPAALAGLAELAAADGDIHFIPMLKLALDKVPRRRAGRGELYRRLGRLSDASGKDARIGRAAWAEVLFELPEDEEAQGRLSVLARAGGDSAQLETALRAQITKTPRGPATRAARLELVALLERSQRLDDALAELRQSVRFEPGHQEAWLALADRLEQRGIWAEAAWALEHGTTATSDGELRMQLWMRLSRFVSERLGDEVKAETYEKRAEKLRRELLEEEPPVEVTNASPLVMAPKGARPPSQSEATPIDHDFEKLAEMLEAVPEPEPTPPMRPMIPKRGGVPAAALELLRVLATGGVVPRTPVQPSAPTPFGARVDVKSSGRGVSARSSAPEARVETKSSGKGLPAVPWGEERPAETKSAPKGVAAVPWGEERGEVKSAGRGVAVPGLEPRPELKSAGRGVSGPGLEPRPELKSAGRGVPVMAYEPRPSEPKKAPPPELKSSGVGIRIPAVEARQKPAIALKPRASAPEPAVSSTASTAPNPAVVLQETKNLRVPQVVVHPPDDDEEWEGSTVGRLDDEDDDQDISVEEAMSGIDDLVEIGSADLELPSEEWEAPPGVQSGEDSEETPTPEGHSTVEIPSAPALGDPSADLPPSFGPSPSKVLSKEREGLFERVRGAPLDPDGYRLLAEHFDAGGDAARSSLMLEIALALEGDPHAAPRAPKMILSATDRAGLKHPVLRGEEGELLGLCGLALCRIYPTRGSEAGTREEFRLDLGKGAKGAADALLTAVRILGLRAPDVYPSNDNGPPFALVFPGAPRLLVGRLAIKRELPEAELRFFAGRALFTQNPDLLCLRNLRREQLVRALQVLSQVLRGQSLSAEARAVRDGLPPKGWERLKQLNERVARKMNLAMLAEGARHSANRAGLVVCGGVAPALAALRAKKALSSEMIELVRFAASERYLVLRSRKLGK